MRQWTGILAGAVLLSGIAGPAFAQLRRAAPAEELPPERVEINGHVWERVRLQYIDARDVVAILSGRALAAFNRQPGLAGALGADSPFGGMGGGFGRSGGPVMGGGFASGGYSPVFGSGYGSWGGSGGMPMGGAGLRPAGFGGATFGSPGVGSGANNGSPPGAFGGPGQGSLLFPNLIIIADPSSNSLLVDP
jgi:hypothetical protein